MDVLFDCVPLPSRSFYLTVIIRASTPDKVRRNGVVWNFCFQNDSL